MGTTPLGLPYPEPTDPVADGAAAIEALAEGVDALLGYRPKLHWFYAVTLTSAWGIWEIALPAGGTQWDAAVAIGAQRDFTTWHVLNEVESTPTVVRFKAMSPGGSTTVDNSNIRVAGFIAYH